MDRPIHFQAWMTATTTMVQVVSPEPGESNGAGDAAEQLVEAAVGLEQGLEDVADGERGHQHRDEEGDPGDAVEPGVALEQHGQAEPEQVLEDRHQHGVDEGDPQRAEQGAVRGESAKLSRPTGLIALLKPDQSVNA